MTQETALLTSHLKSRKDFMIEMFTDSIKITAPLGLGCSIRYSQLTKVELLKDKKGQLFEIRLHHSGPKQHLRNYLSAETIAEILTERCPETTKIVVLENQARWHQPAFFAGLGIAIMGSYFAIRFSGVSLEVMTLLVLPIMVGIIIYIWTQKAKSS